MTQQENEKNLGPNTESSSIGLMPIIYSQLMDIRFADLDPYGHVSTGRYLDLIIGSRFIFFNNFFKTPIEELAKRDLGFFSSHLEIDFIRPIHGVNQVLSESSIQIIETGKQKVSFELKRVSDGKVFSKGFYVEHVINLSTKKTQPLPQWAYPYFFLSGDHPVI